MLSATVTIPLELPTVNTPVHDCALTLYVIALLDPSASDADAVTPTAVSAAAFSWTVLVPELLSLGAPVSYTHLRAHET